MKRFLILALGGVLLCGLIGCQRRDALPENQQSDPGVAKIIQIWMSGSDQEKAFLEGLSREFIAAGNFVGYQFRVVNFPDKTMMEKTFLHKMAEGKGPDIVYSDGQWIYQNTSKLHPRINDETFEPAGFRNTFVRSAHELLIREEQIYGIPLGVDTLAVYYNQDHTQDRLVERNKPSNVWEDFQSDIERLTQTDNSIERFSSSGIALGRVDNMRYGFDILENIMLQQNVNFFSNDQTQATFHTSAGLDDRGRQTNLGVDSVNFYTSFSDPRYKHSSWGAFLASPEDPAQNLDTFAAGDTSMTFGYARDYKYIKDLIAKREAQRKPSMADEVLGISYFPHPKLSGASSRKLVGKVYGLAVTNQSQFSDLAWRYLKFVSRKENLEKVTLDLGIPPARVDLITPFLDDPAMSIFAAQAKFARSNPYPLDQNLLRDWFEDMVQKINDQKGAARTLLTDIGDRVNQYLTTQLQIQREIQPPAPPQRPN